MSVQPKIYSKEDVALLQECYVEKMMSTTEIESQSPDIFGQYISRGTIYKTLIKHDIPVRNKAISVSRAMSTLDIDTTYMNESYVEWIDGLMLGDGYINFRRNCSYGGARVVIGSSSKQWSEFGISRLSSYDPSKALKSEREGSLKHPNPIWISQTKTHPDIQKQAIRWYSGNNEHKVVPYDIRITSISVLLWYLGDGSFHYTKDGNISQLRLATCSFSEDEINLLRNKLSQHGIRTTIYRSKMDIHVCSDSIRNFFNLIGWDSPFSDYDHKFDIPEWLKLYRLSDIVKNDREKWRVQSWYKSGKIEASKSPGGKMLLFTEDQADKVMNKLG